jgi:hypothetical protein
VKHLYVVLQEYDQHFIPHGSLGVRKLHVQTFLHFLSLVCLYLG